MTAPKPATRYTVQVFKAPRWHDVITTKDKQKAEAELKALGNLGRIVETKPRSPKR